MKRRVAVLLAALLCVGAAASSAHAHHSHGMFYDPCTSVTINGTIEGIQWKNPHILIDVKANDGAAFRGEWTSLQGLTNGSVSGPAQEKLKVGERVVIAGNPMRDAATIRASFPAFKEPAEKVIDLTQIRRVNDSWSWMRVSAPTAPRCAQK